MKQIITSIFLMILSFSFSQDLMTSYENSFVSKPYDISVYSKDQINFEVYIDLVSLDKLHDHVGIKLNNKQIQDFIDAINEAKAKYIEWTGVAKENNVDSLKKSMQIKCKTGGYFLYGKEWQFQWAVNLTFSFAIMEFKNEINYYLIIGTGKLISSSNEYIDVDGGLLVFESEEEIDMFLGKITIEKIKEFITKPKEEDLFKD